MKILLINPPLFSQSPYRRAESVSPAPIMGLAYIAGVLRKEGYAVRIMDMFHRALPEVKAGIEIEKPDIIGISCMTDHRANVFSLASAIKSYDRKIRVVLGGIHPTIMYEQVLRNYPVDAVVIGEGEFTFLELIKAWESNLPLENVRGIAFMRGGEVVKTPKRDYIADLDSVPEPAWDCFNFGSYPAETYLRGCRYRGMKLDELRKVHIIASRGCPYNCQFCSSPSVWGSRWRYRSVSRILDEMELLYRDYGCRYFSFVDESFSVNRDRVIEICRGIIDRKLDILWDCETRVNLVSKDILEWMKKAGCYTILYGVESGSPSVLETISKKQTIEQIINAFDLTGEAGIKKHILLMVGNPGESEETVKETCRLLKRVKPGYVAVSVTTVYPGTALYQVAKSRGLIDDDYWLTGLPAPYYTAERSLEQLLDWRHKIWYPYMPFSGKILAKAVSLRNGLAEKTGIFVSKGGIKFGQKKMRDIMMETYKKGIQVRETGK